MTTGVQPGDQDPNRIERAVRGDHRRRGGTQGEGLRAIDRLIERRIPRGGQNRAGDREVRPLDP